MAITIGASTIGLTPLTGFLNLTKGAGLEWGYRWEDNGNPFPVGTTLWIMINNTTRWDFTVAQDQAMLVKAEYECDAIGNRLPFELYIQFTGHPPQCLIKGNTKRLEPR